MDESAAIAVIFAFRFALLLAFFLAGYYGTRQIETRYGEGSAKLPPLAWGFLFLLCFLPALIAAAIVTASARRGFKRRQAGYMSGGVTGWQPPGQPHGDYGASGGASPGTPPPSGGAVPAPNILPGQ